MAEDYVVCRICGKKLGVINYLHLRSHKITIKEYLEKFPCSELSSKSMLKKRSKKLKGRKRTEEIKRRISESNKRAWAKNPNLGRTGISLSKESKKKLSEKLMGHFVSEKTRKKIGKSGLGREPWNKGLTKYNDNRIMNVSKRVREWNKNFMSNEIKKQISQTLKKRYLDGMEIPNTKNGFRKDLKMSFRSTWEANYARILKNNNKIINYENSRFALYDKNGLIENVYIPDFKIDENSYVELKGHADACDNWKCNCKRCKRDKRKLRFMKEQYPHIGIRLIGKKEYKELSQKYNSIIKKWEY